MKKTLPTLLLIGSLTLGLIGCANSAKTAEPAPPPEAENPALEGWHGTWNNFYAYLDRPELDAAYAVKAEKDGKTQAEVKADYLTGQTYRCEIAGMGITRDTVTFYLEPQTVPISDEGIAYQADYADAGDVDINGRIWRHFETSADIPYKHLLFLPVDADVPGETMLHFHFRYGSDLETIKNSEGWYATMVAYDTTDELIIGHITH
ncbi:MAG: metal-binding protein ZinT [Spirochaetaceae bacterium]|jgi:zinc transport system substrate-binding protein|nr:metal-binding protein ZinT [Spirochaetaceae bacterium]